MSEADRAPLRVMLGADAPDHEETRGIAAWLQAAAGISAGVVPLGDVTAADADVVWVHGVRPVALEALGPDGPDLLLRGRVLLTGGAAALPAAAGVDPSAPNESGRSPWPDIPDDDGLPSLRGHACLRGHPLFDGLGPAPLTSAPVPGDEQTLVAYVAPAWPARGRVLAVERSRSRIHRDRATIWEYDGPEGRTLCIGGFLPLHADDPALSPRVAGLARNALLRAGTAAGGEEEGAAWAAPIAAAAEDRSLAMPELPLLEERLGSLEFRLRKSAAAGDDAPYNVAGRRAFAAGGAARGLDEVWAHPLRLAVAPRLAGGQGEEIITTPVGVERRLRVGERAVLERVVVPREAPVCVIEWASRGPALDVEVGWLCDLRPAAPYPPGSAGPLRWRRAPRGLVVASGEADRALFGFSAAPTALSVEDVSGDGPPLLRVRASVRLEPGVPLRLAIVGGSGDATIRRALSAADRGGSLTRARRGHAERLMSDRLAIEAPEPEAVQALEWAKQRLDACLVEAPDVGRSLVTGYGSSPAAPRDRDAPLVTRFSGEASTRAALMCLAVGDARSARDVLVFLGRHQDPTGRVPSECTTTGVLRHDSPAATPLYLVLAARYLAWTGDLVSVRREWGRILGAVQACLAAGAPEGAGVAGAALAVALPALADAAEAIGERGIALELRAAASARPGASADVEPGGAGPIAALIHDTLGAEPDASKGRLVLRPSPSGTWDRFRVSGLAVGDTSVTVDYRREDGEHRFRLAQARGAAPLQLILEPSLPGRALRSASVDGAPAELDARVERDRIVVPVQVVLDHPRDVVLVVEQG